MAGSNDPFDVSGDDDIGADYMGDDEIGAAVRKTLKKRGVSPTRANVAAVVKPSIASRLAATAPGGTDSGRVQMLPLDSITTIAAAATSVVNGNPQRKFRADRFTVSPSRSAAGASLWLINSVNIGVDPQFVANGTVDGTTFDPLATSGANMLGSTATPGINISVSVTNQTAGALRFLGSMTGPSLDL